LEIFMSLAALLTPYIDATVAELRRIVPPLDSHPTFYGQLHYHLGWADAAYQPTQTPSGKRIRSAFCLMACALFAGSYQPAVSAAAAVELLHEFSLVHDDIEDGDRLRRHRPTLWTVVGQPQAINAGDGLFALAQLALLRSSTHGVSAERVLKAQTRFNESAIALCIGQHADMGFETRERVTPDEYLEMIRGKTAALLAFSGEVGALLGGASDTETRTLYELGEAMGLAFQMRDDLLGIWGDPAVTGKPVGADIRAKKKSLPVTYALSHDESGELQTLYSGSLKSKEKVKRVRTLIEATGAREVVAELATQYEAKALTLLDSLTVSEDALRPLRQLADELASRTH
jgi:geranylgeranyl diphosphate synthase type I